MPKVKVNPITIRSTDKKFLHELIEWLDSYQMNVDENNTLVTLCAEEEFDFDNDSGLDNS
jgi:hypothetical protein